MEKGMSDVKQTIADLQRLLDTSKRVPLTNQCVVDRTMMTSLLTLLEESLPTAVEEGSRIVAQESQILADAKQHYDNLTAEAEAKANNRLMEAEQRARAIAQDAEQHANQLVGDAQRQANELIAGAQRKADDLVSQTTINTRAEQQASEKLAQARMNADQMMEMTREHCAKLYKQCENEAITIANELRDARIRLDQER